MDGKQALDEIGGKMKYEVPNPTDIDADFHVITKTVEHNEQFTLHDLEYLSVYCRDNDGEIIGGLTGHTRWHYMVVKYLWVDECHRHQHIGTDLMLSAEFEARSRNCRYAMLDAFEFQAAGFFEKLGYEQFGKLGGYCGKYERYYFRKVLP
jgi:GNAT superfamily N-acetyltransferase